MPSTQAHGKGFNIPADGVEFELTLTTAPDPMEMVQDDGYDATNWKYNGQGVTPRTDRFKLVRPGYCRNLAEVKQRAGAVEGQWRDAFKTTFPENDGKGPIGFADDSWVDPLGSDRFPVLFGVGEAWGRAFLWAVDVRDGDWRWLAPCK